MTAYYNENDPFAAAWLRELIKDGLIAPGDVDERSIVDVKGCDLHGYTQCHFFAGIGGWSYALRLAGWPDDKPVWTGSCPCQPFSNAGKGLGEADERHLWPVFRELIRECQPATVFGEQVASKAGREWLSGVFADLEGMAYQRAGADLCAAGVGAPHIRQRLYWVADATSSGRRKEFADLRGCDIRDESRETIRSSGDRCAVRLADSNGGDASTEWKQRGGEQRLQPTSGGTVGVVDTNCATRKRFGSIGFQVESEQETGRPGNANPWSNYAFIECADGKARRIESGSFPLAHGIPGRVGLLRGFGNAIVPQVAAEFIKAFCEVERETT